MKFVYTLKMPAVNNNLRNKWIPSARLVLCLMVFWGQIQNYMMRVNLSILIVAMIKDPSKNATLNLTNSIQQTCPENRIQTVKNNVTSAEPIDEGLDWDEFTKGQVLGAFSIGYVTTQVRLIQFTFDHIRFINDSIEFFVLR